MYHACLYKQASLLTVLQRGGAISDGFIMKWPVSVQCATTPATKMCSVVHSDIDAACHVVFHAGLTSLAHWRW